MKTNEDDQKQKEYVKKKGLECPFCGYQGIVGDGLVEVDGGIAWQKVSCSDCEKSWHDLYDLVGFDEFM